KYCFVFKPDTTYRLSIQDALIMTGLMKSTDFEPLDPDTITFPPGIVDGLLIPSRANDARLIVPQLIYYDIRIPIFGSANWNEPELLRKNQAVLQNLYFISDYYIETESDNYRQMAVDFKKNFGKEPERMELYGYDTMNALLTVIKSGAHTRESLRQGLLAMPVYHGLCRNISFQGNRPRINSCAFLLGFKQNKIQPVAIIENGAIIEEKTKP
nr:ABC transporter substrate-binding protein [Candidatus Neomarinimicrobiota bacterium]